MPKKFPYVVGMALGVRARGLNYILCMPCFADWAANGIHGTPVIRSQTKLSDSVIGLFCLGKFSRRAVCRPYEVNHIMIMLL